MASKLFVAPSAYPCRSMAPVYLLYVGDEWFENSFHLLVGFTVEHARVLVQPIVLAGMPVYEEVSTEEFTVVKSLAEGRSLLLHSSVSLGVENYDGLENAL